MTQERGDAWHWVETFFEAENEFHGHAVQLLGRCKNCLADRAHAPPRHTPNPVSPGFRAPNASLNLSFGPTALAAAIARTATLRNARIELLRRWRNSALEELELIVADGATFSLSANFDCLADTERTFFAARVGAGITDIMMNALGYTWRDNAACISSTLDPRADFVYAGGNASGYGVVLAEAHLTRE